MGSLLEERIFRETQSSLLALRDWGEEARQKIYDCEKDIVDLCNNLSEFKARSNEIISHSQNALACFDNEEFYKNVRILEEIVNDLVNRLNQIFSLSKTSESKLSKTISSFEKINDELLNFKRIIKRLKMLAISNRIECSRLKEGQEDFLNLAQSIEELGDNISKMIEEIKNKSESLTIKISESLNTIKSLRDAQQNELKTNIAEKDKVLNEINNKRLKIGELSKEIYEYFEEYKNNFSNLIVSFQFQDITRQRMEHVCENFYNIILEYESFTLEKNNLNKLAELDFKAKKILQLQKEQIKDAEEKYLAALEKAQTSLSQIAMNSKEIINKTKSVVESKDVGIKAFEELKNNLEKTAYELTGNSEISKEMIDLIKFIGEILLELSSFIEQIEDIAIDVQLIALNSNIKAAKTGKEGASLSVLADAVKDLSDEARVLIDHISNSLFYISENAKELDLNEMEATFLSIKNQYDPIKNKLGEISSSLNNLSNKSLDNLLNTTLKANKFFSDIEKQIENIENTKIKIDRLENIRRNIDEVIYNLNSELGEIKNAYHIDFSAYEKNYSVDDERQISEKILRNKMVDMKNTGSIFQKNSSDDFGENVTLF